MKERSCDGCAKCCEGWLRGSANGHEFYKGRPCFYLNKTCSIYDDRPADPCRSFKCAWLADDTFPHWMKPDLVNTIITKQKKENFDYYVITEAGGTLQAKTLNWLVQWALNTNNNILYFIEGGPNKIGSRGFIEANI